jgi:hypothetical protein
MQSAGDAPLVAADVLVPWPPKMTANDWIFSEFSSHHNEMHAEMSLLVDCEAH